MPGKSVAKDVKISPGSGACGIRLSWALGHANLVTPPLEDGTDP